jgi:hypothetical protein
MLASSPTQSFQLQKSNALQYPTCGTLFIYLSQIHLLKTATKIFRNQSVRTHCSPPRLALLAPEPSSNAPATSHLLRSRQENSIGRACIAPLNPAARHITTSTQRRLPSTDSSRPWLANHHFSSKPCWHAHCKPLGGMWTVMSISDGAIQGEGYTAGWKFGYPTQKRPSEPPYNGKLTAGQEDNGKANAESKVCGSTVLPLGVH